MKPSVITQQLIAKACIYLIVGCFLSIFHTDRVYASSPAKRFSANPERIAQLDSLAQVYHDQGLFSGSVLVALDGKIILEKGYGFANFAWEIPNSPSTRFDLVSVSKQFNAMAIMILVDEGKLDLDVPISAYLPKLDNKIYNQITCKQLLSHTSGLPSDLLCPIERSDTDIFMKEDLFSVLNNLELFAIPGDRYIYSNAGYNILSFIIEKLSGLEFPDYLQKVIFEPLDMTGSGFIHDNEIIENLASPYSNHLGEKKKVQYQNTSMYVRGAGRLYSTVQDMFKWDQALYKNTLLSEQSEKAMFTAVRANYGFGWELSPITLSTTKEKVRRTWHSGRGPGASAIIQRFVDDNLLVVCLSNLEVAHTWDLSIKLSRILHDGAVRYPKPSLDKKLVDVLFSQGVAPAHDLYVAELNNPDIRLPGPGDFIQIADKKYSRFGDDVKALEILKLVTSLFQSTSFGFEVYGDFLFKTGEKELAIENYRKAIELNLNNIGALRILQFLNVEKPGEIVNPVFLEIFQHGPEAGLIKYRLFQETGKGPSEFHTHSVARNLNRNNRQTEATKLLEFNLMAYPESTDAMDDLAQAYLNGGQKELAISTYKKLLEIDPAREDVTELIEKLEKENM